VNKSVSPEELQLFLKDVADAIPIKSTHIEPFCRHPPPRPLSKQISLQVKISHTISETEVVTENFLDFFRPGVQQKLLQKLRQGHIEVQAELDLHGLTVAYAQESLQLFLQQCHKRNLRFVRIIHGKGNSNQNGEPSVLKCKVNYWLRCYDNVLAFTSTPRWDGGTGAVYVLLRNSKKITT
jgi:DNA-nicking Smr family endonuclease